MRSPYRLLRGQLGSVRTIYLGRDQLDLAPPPAGSTPVVLLHGFFQTRNLWTTLAERLAADGHPVVAMAMPGQWWRYNTRPVRATAAEVGACLRQLQHEHDLAGFHLIGHSMGGLIARAFAELDGGASLVASLSTLGTPHQGTPTAWLARGLLGPFPSSAADLLPGSSVIAALAAQTPFPGTRSIFSRGDLVCPHWCSRLEGGVNLEVPQLGHCELAWDTSVYGHLKAAIDEGGRARRG